MTPPQLALEKAKAKRNWEEALRLCEEAIDATESPYELATLAALHLEISERVKTPGVLSRWWMGRAGRTANGH